jgi:hypothetical protein
MAPKQCSRVYHGPAAIVRKSAAVTIGIPLKVKWTPFFRPRMGLLKVEVKPLYPSARRRRSLSLFAPVIPSRARHDPRLPLLYIRPLSACRSRRR